MSTALEIRCPVGPRRLFAKMIQMGTRPAVRDGNLVEFACADCKREARKEDPAVRTVLHRFDLGGRLIETEVVHA